MLDQAVTSFEQAQAEQDANPQRARQLFRSAAQAFEGVVAGGVRNGRLEYNLGNCYFQAGDIGQAILHYRRAQHLRPRDALVESNLREAQSRCLTTIRPSPRLALLRGFFFWHYTTSIAERLYAAVVLWVAAWVMLLLRQFAPWRWAVGTALVTGLGCAAALGSVGVSRWQERHATPGVVLASDVTAHKGPGKSYQRQFEQPLQPGVEFRLRDSRAEWWNVELADGNRGWIQANQGELVVPGSGILIRK